MSRNKDSVVNGVYHSRQHSAKRIIVEIGPHGPINGIYWVFSVRGPRCFSTLSSALLCANLLIPMTLPPIVCGFETVAARPICNTGKTQEHARQSWNRTLR